MRIKYLQCLIDKIRHKSNIRIYGADNNEIIIDPSSDAHVLITVNGTGNKVLVNTNYLLGNLKVNIYGDNNIVRISKGVNISNLSITIGQKHINFGKVKNSKFEVGENTSIGDMLYETFNSNTYCEIGENCMIAYNVTILNTDAHPIFKKGTKDIINFVKGIKIGDHSWIGARATILKNSIVPPNSIIGYGSVYSGGESHSYCVFAGNPARCVKENVEWTANGSMYGYIENDYKS